MDPGRLNMAITHSDGRVTRWGPDEPNAQDIPDGLSFSSSIPGGYKDCTFSLPRRIDLEYADLNLFDDVHVYGAGGRTAWRGRMQQFPKSHGDSVQITPSALGYSAHLRDDPSFREIYVDRDLSHWGPVTNARQSQLLASTIALQGTGFPIVDGFEQSFTGAWTLANRARVEAMYDAGVGVALGRVRGSFSGNTNMSGADANWNLHVALGTDDVFASSDATADLWTSSSGTFDLAATTSSRRYGTIFYYYGTGPAGADGTLWSVLWTNLRMFGNHGLTIRGTIPDDGYYASDVIENVVSRAAPLLSTNGIEATDFVIPHLAFPDPVTAEDVIIDANKFHMYEWGVYGNREFFYRAPDPNRLTWGARLSRGARLDLEGDTGETVFNGALVFFKDAAGTSRVAGPPAAYWANGTALADYTDAQLVDTNEDNPANASDIPRRWAKLELQFPTTSAGAILLGAAYLREKALPQRRGTLTLQGPEAIEHPTEGFRPTWQPLAGDYVQISDQPTYVARRIVETRYDHNTGTASLMLDNTSAKFDKIMERVGIKLVGTAF